MVVSCQENHELNSVSSSKPCLMTRGYMLIMLKTGNIVKHVVRTINQPFGNRFYQLFMVISGMVDCWFNNAVSIGNDFCVNTWKWWECCVLKVHGHLHGTNRYPGNLYGNFTLLSIYVNRGSNVIAMKTIAATMVKPENFIMWGSYFSAHWW